MILDTSGGNKNSFGSNESVLEVLNNVGRQVSDVVFVSVQFVSQSTLSEGGGVDGIVKGLISSEMIIKLMALFVFMNTDT